MDMQIAAEELAALDAQAAAALGGDADRLVLPERETEGEDLTSKLTPEQEAFLRGKRWTIDRPTGVIIVVHSGPLHGPIPRGIRCIPASNKTLRRRRAVHL